MKKKNPVAIAIVLAALVLVGCAAQVGNTRAKFGPCADKIGEEYVGCLEKAVEVASKKPTPSTPQSKVPEGLAVAPVTAFAAAPASPVPGGMGMALSAPIPGANAASAPTSVLMPGATDARSFACGGKDTISVDNNEEYAWEVNGDLAVCDLSRLAPMLVVPRGGDPKKPVLVRVIPPGAQGVRFAIVFPTRGFPRNEFVVMYTAYRLRGPALPLDAVGHVGIKYNVSRMRNWIGPAEQLRDDMLMHFH